MCKKDNTSQPSETSQKYKCGLTFKNQSVIHHIKSIKEKNYIIISMNMEKPFNKIQCEFIIETRQIKNRRELPHLIKCIYIRATKMYLIVKY